MHEELKKEITEYLKNKYRPETIILHGSRASDNYREHSDWDLFVFVKEDEEGLKTERDLYKAQAMDITLVNFPKVSQNIIEKLIAVAHSIEVLYDTEEVGSKLINDAKKERSKGIRLSKEEKERIVIEMYKDINNLNDLQENDGVFFFRLGRDFFRNALNGWFRVIRDEYSLPPYLSIPYIKEQDPEYYACLEVLWSHKSNKEKVDAAKAIFQKIENTFKNVV
ncbi:nucleotidyltransferase domain-containing protein [Candidatus Nomurabacteria bacterium]|nr:nucleotidyltransferase domain-containing protein [Candidatus Nomurabacteria bacterium]